MKTDPISDAELAQLDRSLERCHRDGSLYNELYSAGEVRALRARLRRAEEDNRCDACIGASKPLGGGPCMCGGTGKMSDAAKWLRDSWLNDVRLHGKGPEHCGSAQEVLRIEEKPRCLACNGSRRILEDHDGRAGYRVCEECR